MNDDNILPIGMVSLTKCLSGQGIRRSLNIEEISDLYQYGFVFIF